LKRAPAEMLRGAAASGSNRNQEEELQR
jgi:hypothetical protein